MTPTGDPLTNSVTYLPERRKGRIGGQLPRMRPKHAQDQDMNLRNVYQLPLNSIYVHVIGLMRWSETP